MSKRRSTRAESSNTVLNDVSNNAPVALTSLAPPKKRTRKQSASTQQPGVVKLGAKNGGLQFITRFPFDVLYTIFGLLQPRDLLALMRTTKAIREVLLNKCSTSVWISAFKNVSSHEDAPFPPCPAHLQPPQYASLVFDSFCMICYKENGKIQLTNLQLRTCSSCAKQNLARPYEYIDSYHTETMKMIHECIPRCMTMGPYFLMSFKPHMDGIMAVVNESTPDQIEAWVKSRKEELVAIEMHEIQLEGYFQFQQATRTVELESLREGRLSAIIERLCANGWDEEIEFDPVSLARHPLVNKPQALTDRIWNNIKEQLFALMQEIRDDMEVEKFAEEIAEKELSRMISFQRFATSRLLDRVQIIPLEPRVCDIMSSSIFKRFLEHLWLRWILEDLPDELAVFEADAIVAFPVAMSSWRRAVAVALYDHTASTDVHDHLKLDIRKSDERKQTWLNRATNSFKCTLCTEQPGHAKEMRYPYILSHSCQRSLYSGAGVDCAKPSAHRGLQFHHTRSKIITRLLEAAGLDSFHTTHAQLDAKDARFICRTCVKAGDGDPGAMTWWRCLEHYDTHHIGTSGRLIEWKRLPRAAEVEVRKLAPGLTGKEREGWRCLLCFNRNQRVLRVCPSWDEAVTHVKDEHDLESVKIGKHLTSEDNYMSVTEPQIVQVSTLHELNITCL